MEPRRIAILSASVGAGHIRAAEALQAAAAALCPQSEVVHVDVLSLVNKLFRKIYADLYLRVVKYHPALWGYVYEKTDQQRADSLLRRMQFAVERLNVHRLKRALRDLGPDVLLCTHFLPAQLLSRWVGEGDFTCPVWVQVTDFDVHRLWICDHMTGYFAANEDVAWRMADRGLRRESIHVTGIPIMPVFGEKWPREACVRDLGLDPSRPVLLMMAGGAGVGEIELLASRLLPAREDLQIVALAGRNEDLLGRLRGVAAQYPRRLVPLPFTRTIERVMAASDLAITKPGGLTTSECLAMGLPMVLVSPIPGQEDRNADYLLEQGVSLKAHDAAGLEYRVLHLLQSPKRLAEMKRRASLIARPHAASDALRIALGHWAHETTVS